jgi:phosphoribosylaminoimidazole-succinocarboxamide synthase
MGSVKDLETVRKPTESSMGIGRFHFSDRYSVFDWGEMPDHIEGKGAALCLMGAYCFEKLEEKGIKTHYRGLVDESGKVVRLDDLKRSTNTMEISLVNVFSPKTFNKNGKLQYDYSKYTPNLKNYLIPLEIIYRNGLPEGSSIFKRLEQGLTTIQDLGLDHYPKLGEKLPKPIFDASTKLEEIDRYLNWKEAQTIAGMTTSEVEEVKELLLKVDATITNIAIKANLQNEDGKIELAFNPERKLIVVDVVGTLDESRFTYDGLHVGKEIARQFYRKTDWYRNVEEAKKKAEALGVKDWKRLCISNPPKLDSRLKRMISEMYMAASNELTKDKMFDAPTLNHMAKEYNEYSMLS